MFQKRAKNICLIVQAGGTDIESQVASVLLDVHQTALEELAEELHRMANKAVQDGNVPAQRNYNDLAAMARRHKNPNHKSL